MNSSRLQNYTIYHNNSEEYHRIKKEVFTSDSYYFETENPTPFIIDAGAHIGLSTLYFKQTYPKSEVVALEPNPNSFELLEKNLFENQIDGVTAVKVALSDHEGFESFFLDETEEQWYSTAGFHRGSWVGTQRSEEITVPTQKLSSFVTKPVDLLKMDIEGAEQKVLFASQDCLWLIKEINIEFHPHPTQSLPKLVELLERTHKVELFKNTNSVLLKKAIGLVQIRASIRSSHKTT
ncbi:MAG: hypothetical protein BroJett025_01230 [Patescibacteria group bacterium]|nr:MAG: hypothetical protein BroJett025_01230 [Patescibacteria group bacterium]